jgi:hypothetical protein
MGLRGVTIPADTAALQLRARVRGAPLALDLVVRDERGRIDRLPLTKVGKNRSLLTARMPAVGSASRPREVIALGLQLSKAGRAWLLHLARENRVQRVPSGTLAVGGLASVDAKGAATPLTDWQGWIVRGRRATVAGRTGRTLHVSYVFPEVASLYLRPRQPTDAAPVPVVVSPAVAEGAGPDGLLTLDLYDSQLRAKVVGVARRFPTLGEDEEFILGDERTVSTAMDADAPGTGTPGEMWLAVPRERAGRVERALSQPPFSQLQRSSRRALYERAHADPLSRGLEIMLGAAALLALVLALIGLWASLLSDLRDERDTFFDLEAQGAGPETLRRHLRIRALVLLAFGLAGGMLLGLVLTRLVVSVVHVTGAATEPIPPLVLDAGFGAVAVALVALLGATALAVELTVRRAFRGSSPQRASWSLE